MRGQSVKLIHRALMYGPDIHRISRVVLGNDATVEIDLDSSYRCWCSSNRVPFAEMSYMLYVRFVSARGDRTFARCLPRLRMYRKLIHRVRMYGPLMYTVPASNYLHEYVLVHGDCLHDY